MSLSRGVVAKSFAFDRPTHRIPEFGASVAALCTGAPICRRNANAVTYASAPPIAIPIKTPSSASPEARQIPTAPEELRLEGRELFIYFPNGMDGYKFWMVFTPLDDNAPPGRDLSEPDQADH